MSGNPERPHRGGVAAICSAAESADYAPKAGATSLKSTISTRSLM